MPQLFIMFLMKFNKCKSSKTLKQPMAGHSLKNKIIKNKKNLAIRFLDFSEQNLYANFTFL